MNLHIPRRFAVGTPVEFFLSYLRMFTFSHGCSPRISC